MKLKKTKQYFCFGVALLLGAIAAVFSRGRSDARQESRLPRTDAMTFSDDDLPQTESEWRNRLTPEQFRILRRHGTERAFTGEYWDHHETGMYECAGCGLPLFDSESKFDSGTGWPSFYQPVGEDNVGTEQDNSLFMRRTEVHCNRCQGHLGHVFDDGPRPTGLRYCINSAALKFADRDAAPEEKDAPTSSDRDADNQ